jgi:hypothetical protein
MVRGRFVTRGGSCILNTHCLSSLSKVFADEELKDESYTNASALLNVTFSFQVTDLLKYVSAINFGGFIVFFAYAHDGR